MGQLGGAPVLEHFFGFRAHVAHVLGLHVACALVKHHVVSQNIVHVIVELAGAHTKPTSCGSLTQLLRVLYDNFAHGLAEATANAGGTCRGDDRVGTIEVVAMTPTITDVVTQLLLHKPRCACIEATDAFIPLLCIACRKAASSASEIRSFAVVFGTACATLVQLPVDVSDAAVNLVQLALELHNDTATLSSTCLAFGLVAVRMPIPSHVLAAFIRSVLQYAQVKAKDLNFTGSILPVAVSLALHCDDYNDILPDLSSFCSVWVSLFAHCDARAQDYSVQAWSRMRQRWGDWMRHTSITVLHVPSLIRNVHRGESTQSPPQSITMTVADAIAKTLESYLQNLHRGEVVRWRNFAQLPAFDVLRLRAVCPGIATADITAKDTLHLLRVQH